jgi:hypothetical protein
MGREKCELSIDGENWLESDSGLQSGQLGTPEAELAGVDASLEVHDESSGYSDLASSDCLCPKLELGEADPGSEDKRCTNVTPL